MWCSHLQLSLALHLMHHMALNQRDKNRTAAYLRVRPRLGALPLSPHLHFVARAKHCHLKPHTNLPPYGHSPQKVARQSHTATICFGGERDVCSPCLIHRDTPARLTSLHPNPSSFPWIAPNSSLYHQPLCPPPPKKIYPHDNFKK